MSHRALHLDAFSGIAGNMLLGALFDAGLSRRAWEAALAGLDLEYRLVARRVRRGTIAARHVAVRTPRAAARGAGRSFADVCRVLRRARLHAAVRERALGIFELLARAEAAVHGVPVERVHFHEVGAVDAIVDITGAAAALHCLDVTRVTCSPLALGHGTVETEHGRLPLPAPATLELLRGCPVFAAGVDWETVTPTGAALVRALVEQFAPAPEFEIEAVGYGAGEDRPGPLPNVLRVVLGTRPGWGRDRVHVLETHIDDLNPEHFDFAMERLFAAGALDVGLQHLQMKKNRPGFSLRVVAPLDRSADLAAVLFAETSTAGVRVTPTERLVLKRTVRHVATSYGRIRVKWIAGLAESQPAPEYEDCKRAARRAGVTLREVVAATESAARRAGAPR